MTGNTCQPLIGTTQGYLGGWETKGRDVEERLRQKAVTNWLGGEIGVCQGDRAGQGHHCLARSRVSQQPVVSTIDYAHGQASAHTGCGDKHLMERL